MFSSANSLANSLDRLASLPYWGVESVKIVSLLIAKNYLFGENENEVS
jgi:hypothetical protein